MKITIVGAGALGLLLAYNLSKSKNEVWVFDSDSSKVKKISQDGIKLENSQGSNRIKLDITSDPKSIGQVDLVIICVKSYDTENALKNIKALLSDKTYVLTLQDGLGNLQLISELVESEMVIGGVTYHEAVLKDEFSLLHSQKGDTIIGQENGKVLGDIRDIAAVLTKAGFATKVSKDINSIIWTKLVISVGINALSAVTRLKNGALVENEYTREIMRRAVSEAVKVAKKKKAKLAYDDPIQKVEAVCRATADSLSFMLQDVLNGKPTEIDYINGAIIRHAKSLGIKTFTNEMLVELVKAIEINYKSSLK